MKILFIPHVPNTTLINRVYEFAKNSDSYSLHWHIDNSSFKAKVLSQLYSLKYVEDGKSIQIPLLFKPESIAPKVNTFFLNRLIKKLNIECVVNANALLFDIKSISVKVVYDLVDDHLEVNPDIGLTQKRVQKIKTDIENSQGVICVSEFVEKKVQKLHHTTLTVGNGIYYERFKKAKSLKKELGLEGKKVFGYIGGVDEWTGIKEAIESYLKIQNDTNALMIVGGSEAPYYQELYKKYRDRVLFVGKVAPSSVAEYFKTVDVGLIPFKLNPFTNNALPIKALEYALGGARVLSTPLEYLRFKNYPFVQLSSIEQWSEVMQEDHQVQEYAFETLDWKNRAQEVVAFVEGIDEK